MDDVEEKRVFGEPAGESELVVAAALGVLSVSVSGASVGPFGVVHRCDPVAVAASAGRVAVATDEDVLLREDGAAGFEPTGFGPAAAVGFDRVVPVAASPDGRVARPAEGAGEDVGNGTADDGGAGWSDLGRLETAVRAIDGRLLAAADGVHRLPGLEYAGLDDARDVAAAGPLVATGEGLFSLGNGWMDELDGAFRVVAAGDGRAHAATADDLFERTGDGWRPVDLPVDGTVVDVAYGDAVYAVTAEGDLLARDGDGWRAHPLGVAGVVGCAAPRATTVPEDGD